MSVARTPQSETIFQEFLATGYYYKPAGAALITFEIIGGGGGGQAGELISSTTTSGTGSRGGQGGGGTLITVPSDVVPDVLLVGVGSGGAGGSATTVAGATRATGSNGTFSYIFSSGATPQTSPQIYIYAYGGVSGGSGNGQSSATLHFGPPFTALTLSTASAVDLGFPIGGSYGNYSQLVYDGIASDIGGGGGGHGASWSSNNAGTIYRAAFGGRRYGTPLGTALWSNPTVANTYISGGGGAYGNTESGVNPTAGQNGTLGSGGGGGGASGKTSATASGASGGNGGFPGGGGGGGGSGYAIVGSAVGGAGGAGGNGRVRIWTVIARS